jgi:hypothetical protein
MTYSFEFRDITFSEQYELVWLLADGDGTQAVDDGATETFANRLTGVLPTPQISRRGPDSPLHLSVVHLSVVGQLLRSLVPHRVAP